MTIKQYLRQAYRLDEKIRTDQAELDQLRELSATVKGLIIGDRIQSSPRNAVEDAVIKVVSLEEKIANEIKNLVEVKENIRLMIESLDNETEKLICAKRYLLFMSWEDIAVDLNYSCRHVTRLHGRSLLKLERKRKTPEA
jgi:DNA-directed RNA polymerase specialized sigma subunit